MWLVGHRICMSCLAVFAVVAISFDLLGDRSSVEVDQSLRKRLVLVKDSAVVAAVGELVVDQAGLLILDLVVEAGSRNTIVAVEGRFRNSVEVVEGHFRNSVVVVEGHFRNSVVVVDGNFRNSERASSHRCIASVLVLLDNQLGNPLDCNSGSEVIADQLFYEVLLEVVGLEEGRVD